MFVPRFLRFAGYKTVDYRTSVRDNSVVVYLEPEKDKPFSCHRCGTELTVLRGSHPLILKDLPLRGFTTHLKLRRRKGHCPRCKKARSESIAFLAKESPHVTQEYSWWLGQMCEFSPVSRIAEMTGEGNMFVRRIDLKRMQRMLKHYKLPPVTHIAVDEVYTRKKKRFKDEDRDARFFTVITDLTTRRVIWVEESRKKKALDRFFALIGKAQCEQLKVVAVDQHDAYAQSVRENCPGAKVVWDKFHILQNFGEAVNQTRKNLHNWIDKDPTIARLARGKYRFNFLKRDSKRNAKEKAHIQEIVKANEDFSTLEIIKERMLTFFDAGSEDNAQFILNEVGKWIQEKAQPHKSIPEAKELAFEPLWKWWKTTHAGWDTLKNYFIFPVTSALAEGVNNVVKALKRRAFGFRNMDYFRLKIMQVCGYLNSRYIKFPEALGT